MDNFNFIDVLIGLAVGFCVGWGACEVNAIRLAVKKYVAGLKESKKLYAKK